MPEDRRGWRIDLDPKIQVACDLAREFSVMYIPLDGLFAAASVQREPGFWLPFGMHPSREGQALIAQTWLKAVQAID